MRLHRLTPHRRKFKNLANDEHGMIKAARDFISIDVQGEDGTLYMLTIYPTEIDRLRFILNQYDKKNNAQ